MIINFSYNLSNFSFNAFFKYNSMLFSTFSELRPRMIKIYNIDKFKSNLFIFYGYR